MTTTPPLPGQASPARVYDYLLGGHHNTEADREAATALIRAFPLGARIAVYNRAFLGRAVRYLVGQGIRQFVDLGSGIPTAGNVHEMAHAEAPGSQVVYVDHAPDAVELSQSLLSDVPDATCILADIRDPETILRHPDLTGLIDLTQPVGLLSVAVLHFIPDDDDPLGLMAAYVDALAPGSYVALSHVISPEQGRLRDITKDAAKSYNQHVATGVTLRSREVIQGFFRGLEMVPPGLVLVADWRPDDPGYQADDEDEPRHTILGGVARVPGVVSV